MTLKTDIQELAKAVPDFRDVLTSEQATKQALVVPFIKALGYNVYDPREVVPEYVADLGTKRGEKVDYAIMKDSVPVILIECKSITDKLNGSTVKSQLFRYFVATSKVRLGLLTNGVKYQFFSDLDNQNVMDLTPFLEVDLENLTDSDMDRLERFVKGFDVAATVEEAARIRQIDLIKALLCRQLIEPDDEFVDWVQQQLYPDEAIVPFMSKFPETVREALRDFVNDKIHETLPVAQNLTRPEKDQDIEMSDDADETGSTKLQWLSDYIPPDKQKGDLVEAIGLLQGILKDMIDLNRVQVKCGVSTYVSMQRDGRRNEPICRIWFGNNGKSGFGYFDGSRNENGRAKPVEVPIDQPADILQYREQIQAAAILEW